MIATALPRAANDTGHTCSSLSKNFQDPQKNHRHELTLFLSRLGHRRDRRRKESSIPNDHHRETIFQTANPIPKHSPFDNLTIALNKHIGVTLYQMRKPAAVQMYFETIRSFHLARQRRC